jgi:hypothetical protein
MPVSKTMGVTMELAAGVCAVQSAAILQEDEWQVMQPQVRQSWK